MSLQIPLTALMNNDNNYFLDILFNGEPLNLASYTPHVYVKASQTAADNTGTTYNIGSGLTWVNQSLGKLKLTIPHANTTQAGTFWWRLDIVDASNNVFTALYGPLTVKAI